MEASRVQAGASTPSLDRRLGPLDAAAIIVSNVIGSGIFIVPVIVALMVPHPLGMLSVWVAGGVLAFFGAMAYAELAALRPRAGGEYVYLREAFGPIAAFLTGWTSFVAGFSGAIAASSVGLAAYLGRFVPFAADTTPLASVPLGPVTFTLSPQALVALAAIGLLTAVHVCGLGPGRVVQNLLAALKVGAIVAFVVLGFLVGRGSEAHFVQGGGAIAPTSWVLALIPVMFSYSGWNAAAYVAEEIREPGRNVPRALAIGTFTVIVLYVGLNLLYLYAMPVADLMRLQIGVRVVDVSAERLFGPAVADLLAGATIVMIAASVSAMIIAGPRVYYAMARDGLFFRAGAVVHPRFRTPVVAIVAQSLWSSLLVLSGTFTDLVNYTGFAVVLFAGVAVLALFVLRRRRPADERPVRAWGYPVAPLVFAVASLLMVANAIWREPGPSLAGVLIIGAGVPLYAVMRAYARMRASVMPEAPTA
jgi:APA family basic amino acid/polyamine antiporter